MVFLGLGTRELGLSGKNQGSGSRFKTGKELGFGGPERGPGSGFWRGLPLENGRVSGFWEKKQ